jgi:predicted DNA-binding transcriptional regulator AlpA
LIAQPLEAKKGVEEMSRDHSKRRHSPEPEPFGEFLRPQRAALFLGISRSELYRLSGRPGFPPKRRLGENMSGWLKEELLAWLREHAKPKTSKLVTPSDRRAGTTA